MLIATSNFLIPNATFIAELIAFLIILGILAKWVLPPLNKAMQQRQEQIKASLEAAERARADAAATEDERIKVIDAARREARTIIDQASKASEDIKAQGRVKGEQEYQRLVMAAQSEIEMARQRAINEVSARAAELAIAIAEKVIGEELDIEKHRALIEEAIASLNATPTVNA